MRNDEGENMSSDTINDTMQDLADAEVTTKKPTTAELFATLEDLKQRHIPPARHGRFEDALSELERRTGAMERAIQNAPHGPYCASQRVAPKPCDCWKASALTDAPPVFTLEEVEAAIGAATVPSHLEVSAELKRCIRANLAALRR